MEARRTQGTALKNDITRYELQKETLKLQLAKVQDACKIMNHQLVTTLHLPAGTEIVPDSTLLDEEVRALAENDWQLLATQSNVGLQQAQLAVKMNEQKVKLERSELLPKVALVAGEHLDGPITIEVPVLDNNFNYWYVGVGIKYNLSSLFKNNKKVRKAEYAESTGRIFISARADRKRRAGELRQLPDFLHRPPHAREKCGTGRSELQRDQQPLQKRFGSAHRYARCQQHEAERRLKSGKRTHQRSLQLLQDEIHYPYAVKTSYCFKTSHQRTTH